MSQADFDHLRHAMSQKSTEELIQIWRESDTDAWTGEAIAVVTTELQKRLGQLPTTAELDAWISTEDANEPGASGADTFADIQQLMRVAEWAKRLSWAFLIFSGVAAMIVIIAFVTSNSATAPNLGFYLGAGIGTLLPAFQYALNGFFSFVVLQALSEGIYLFLDIEDNTRPK
ncbi:MAG TPA: hypothetical protein P5121_10415 [Caldilineaceae bacterium]|nr:hypothetical protein [Caldilineaceae bacterium]